MSERLPPDAERWPNDVLPRGTTLNGYRVVRLLGRGGFGVTYLAEDLLGQMFAIKEYFPRQFALRHGTQVYATSDDEVLVFDDCRSRFVHEARALVGLARTATGQQDIVRVQTFFEANGTAYMVMEYIVGRTLQAMLREHPHGLAPAELRRILGGILGGLAVVHDAGLMHRDIKPANILLRDDVRPVLIDFGSSREAQGTQTHGFTQIFSGGYAPPEQVMGTRQGPFSDIYAVGAIGYEAIGGTVADALTRQHAVAAHTPDPMPTAAQVGAGRYDAALLAVIDAAMALDPTKRPNSAGTMARMLVQSEAAPAKIQPPAQPKPPPPAPRIAPVPAPPPPSPPAASLPPTARPIARLTARRWPIFAGLGGAMAAGVALWFAFGQAPAPTLPRSATAPPHVPIAPVPPRPLPPVNQPLPPELLALRAAALELPCALLFPTQGEGADIAIGGLALRDGAFEAFMRQARSGGRIVRAAVDSIEPALCPPVSVIAAAVQRERERETLRLSLAEDVVAGARFGATLQGTGGGMLQIDLFGIDGTVHHVLRRALPSGQWSIRLQIPAAPVPGQQLLVAIATAGALGLDQRPPREPAAVYLPLLRHALKQAEQATASAPRAEFLFYQAAPPKPTASP